MDTVKSILGAVGAGGGDGNGDADIQVPKDGDMPSREEMLQTIETLQKAQKAQSAANGLREKAKAMTSPVQREKMLKEAFEKETEANGLSKMAKRMQSGPWQGFGFGGGIGAASGLGLGTGVGMLLGAITAVPATGLGMLIGTGVGAIHGPWVKLGGGKNGKEEHVPFEDADPERVVDAMEAERQARLEKGAAAESNGSEKTESAPDSAEKPRRKPPKLEVRSKKNADGSEGGVQKQANVEDKPQVTAGVAEESKPPRRKPKKLEIRSGKDGSKAQSVQA
jgi:hypothetical protein